MMWACEYITPGGRANSGRESSRQNHHEAQCWACLSSCLSLVSFESTRKLSPPFKKWPDIEISQGTSLPSGPKMAAQIPHAHKFRSRQRKGRGKNLQWTNIRNLQQRAGPFKEHLSNKQWEATDTRFNRMSDNAYTEFFLSKQRKYQAHPPSSNPCPLKEAALTVIHYMKVHYFIYYFTIL